jgi:hypothetical protein
MSRLYNLYSTHIKAKGKKLLTVLRLKTNDLRRKCHKVWRRGPNKCNNDKHEQTTLEYLKRYCNSRTQEYGLNPLKHEAHLNNT